MAIIVNLDMMLAKRKMTSLELANRIGMTPANLSILKTGKAKAVRMSTMDAICRELQCQPGDLFEFVEDDDPWKRQFPRVVRQNACTPRRGGPLQSPGGNGYVFPPISANPYFPQRGTLKHCAANQPCNQRYRSAGS